ncbi:hypothetical protein [Oceanivirga miroungae]|nr:hypothetical protein [Oceanivirga miroungae]
MKFLLKKDRNDGLANNNSKIQIEINARQFSNNTIKNLISLKDEYFSVDLNYENISYNIDKMYIYNIEQVFVNGEISFNIVLYQKYMTKDKEIKVIEN